MKLDYSSYYSKMFETFFRNKNNAFDYIETYMSKKHSLDFIDFLKINELQSYHELQEILYSLGEHSSIWVHPLLSGHRKIMEIASQLGHKAVLIVIFKSEAIYKDYILFLKANPLRTFKNISQIYTTLHSDIEKYGVKINGILFIADSKLESVFNNNTEKYLGINTALSEVSMSLAEELTIKKCNFRKDTQTAISIENKVLSICVNEFQKSFIIVDDEINQSINYQQHLLIPVVEGVYENEIPYRLLMAFTKEIDSFLDADYYEYSELNPNMYRIYELIRDVSYYKYLAKRYGKAFACFVYLAFPSLNIDKIVSDYTEKPSHNNRFALLLAANAKFLNSKF